MAVFPSSSSSSPSFRSDIGGATTTTAAAAATVSSAVVLGLNPQINRSNTTNDCRYHQQHIHHHSNRSKLLYLLGQNKKKKKDLVNGVAGGGVHDRSKNLVFKRSKSTADNDGGLTSHHKRGFWSYFYLQKHTNSNKTLRDISSNSLRASAPHVQRSHINTIVVEENEPACQVPIDRKVSRSRSVGCGSRSFSGDFFERISTGLGDCTLRRVESQREGKPKLSTIRSNGGQDCIHERVRCGGLFSGFMITSSSSSSSSSSNYVASNPNEGTGGNDTGKVTSAVAGTGQQHTRSKSWGWALASPMRAFSKPSSTSSKKEEASKKNQTPNLAAIPSLLSVRS